MSEMRANGDHNTLALKAGTGDAQAFRALLEAHYDSIYRIALRFFGNTADAEDITQEVCLALPKKLRRFGARAKFSTWLYQVVINACRDHVRRQSTRAATNAGYEEVAALRREAAADTNERLEWLQRALAQLSPDLRETAVLVVAEDLTHAEAGEILGVKESTVSWRMHELRKQLKALATADEGV